MLAFGQIHHLGRQRTGERGGVPFGGGGPGTNPAHFASVSQLAEEGDLKSLQCEFDSHRDYHINNHTGVV